MSGKEQYLFGGATSCDPQCATPFEPWYEMVRQFLATLVALHFTPVSTNLTFPEDPFNNK